MSDSDLILGGEFAPVSYEDWVAEVEKVLKGAPFDKKMLHRTYDGITVQPIYTREDWPADGDPSGFPGAGPFTRVSVPTGVVIDFAGLVPGGVLIDARLRLVRVAHD